MEAERDRHVRLWRIPESLLCRVARGLAPSPCAPARRGRETERPKRRSEFAWRKNADFRGSRPFSNDSFCNILRRAHQRSRVSVYLPGSGRFLSLDRSVSGSEAERFEPHCLSPFSRPGTAGTTCRPALRGVPRAGMFGALALSTPHVGETGRLRRLPANRFETTVVPYRSKQRRGRL